MLLRWPEWAAQQQHSSSVVKFKHTILAKHFSENHPCGAKELFGWLHHRAEFCPPIPHKHAQTNNAHHRPESSSTSNTTTTERRGRGRRGRRGRRRRSPIVLLHSTRRAVAGSCESGGDGVPLNGLSARAICPAPCSQQRFVVQAACIRAALLHYVITVGLSTPSKSCATLIGCHASVGVEKGRANGLKVDCTWRLETFNAASVMSARAAAVSRSNLESPSPSSSAASSPSAPAGASYFSMYSRTVAGGQMPPSDGRPLGQGGKTQYGPFDEDVPDKRKTNRDPSSDMKRMPTNKRHERSAQALARANDAGFYLGCRPPRRSPDRCS